MIYAYLPKQVTPPLSSPKTSLRAGGTHLAVLARSVAAYLYVALSTVDIDKASRQLSLQTTKALMALFKYVSIFSIVIILLYQFFLIYLLLLLKFVNESPGCLILS